MKREGGYGEWGNGERRRKKRKWGNVERQSLSISSSFPHSLFISSFSLHFLATRLPGCHNLCNPVVYIAYYTELNLHLCNYAQKRRICRENSNENFYGHFCFRRKAGNFCHSVNKEFRNSHATLRHKPKWPLNWLYFVRKVQDCVLHHPMRKHLLPWKKKVGGHKWKRFIKHFSLDRPSLPPHRWNYVPV